VLGRDSVWARLISGTLRDKASEEDRNCYHVRLPLISSVRLLQAHGGLLVEYAYVRGNLPRAIYDPWDFASSRRLG